jgi:signal-transduction protein with cAMP-binding, CBS, and nucleotidyltransferase domain
MVVDPLVAPLLRVELFQGLKSAKLTQISRIAERVVFRPGDVITQSGNAADAAFLIVSGAAEWQFDAELNSEAEPIEIGSLIGEMAMLIEHISGSTIIAKTQVRCLALSRSAMHTLMLEDPGLAQHLVAKISRRLSNVADNLRAIDHEFDEPTLALFSEPATLPQPSMTRPSMPQPSLPQRAMPTSH